MLKSMKYFLNINNLYLRNSGNEINSAIFMLKFKFYSFPFAMFAENDKKQRTPLYKDMDKAKEENAGEEKSEIHTHHHHHTHKVIHKHSEGKEAESFGKMSKNRNLQSDKGVLPDELREESRNNPQEKMTEEYKDFKDIKIAARKPSVKPLSSNETKIHGNMKGMENINRDTGIEGPMGVQSPTKKGRFVYRGNLNLDSDSERSENDDKK